MQTFEQASARKYLTQFGVPPEVVQDVIDGFDFGKAVYEQHFWPGDRLFQLIRLPSMPKPSGYRGNWYGIAGITTGGVAVMDGVAGRRLHEFEVVKAFSAIEGTAAKIRENWQIEVGGSGGATQIFVPQIFMGHIAPVGPTDRW